MIISCEYDSAADRGRNLSAAFDMEGGTAEYTLSVFDRKKNIYVRYRFDKFSDAAQAYKDWAKIYAED